MPPRYLRPLLIIEFLIALQAVFTCWSQIGGQYHLDLMFWPWKLGVSFACAFLVTAITGNIVRRDGAIGKRVWLYAGLLVLTAAAAGVVTYYYHVNEPSDEDDQTDDQTSITQAYDARSPFVGSVAAARHAGNRAAANETANR